MRIEYRPIHLSAWVRKEIKQNSISVDLNSEAIQNRLERLKGALGVMKNQSNEAFHKWLTGLVSRDSVLLPFVYEEVQTKFHKEVMLKRMLEVAKFKRQLFFNALEQCYATGNFNPYWNIVRIAFDENYTAIVRNWTDNQKKLWSRFIRVNHSQLSHVSYELNKINAPLAETIKEFNINESHKVYDKVFIEMFSKGSKQLFRDEQKLFLEYLTKSDTLTAQLLVTGFIKSDSLVELDDISIKVFEKMGTHIKQPMLWADVEEAVKVAFHGWYLRKNIREFFSGIDKNHERFVYWEKFIPKMNDALVIKKERTILFYFSDVVIMEVLGTGAVYVYDINYFNKQYGHLVDGYREATETKAYKEYGYIQNKLTRGMLMDKGAVIKGGWLTHSGAWQVSFDQFLRYRLNWEVDRNAIIQKSKTHFTI